MKLSGLYYPNKLGYFYANAIQEVLGEEALQTIAKASGIPGQHFPPPNNYAKSFDFAYMGAVGAALNQIYGPRGERGVGLNAGRASFTGGLAEYGTLVGATNITTKLIPLQAKVLLGLRALAETFNKFSDQITTVEQTETHYVYNIHNCPLCWGRSDNQHVCYVATGQIERGLIWVTNGATFKLEEVSCRATGAEMCSFHIEKEPLTLPSKR